PPQRLAPEQARPRQNCFAAARKRSATQSPAHLRSGLTFLSSTTKWKALAHCANRPSCPHSNAMYVTAKRMAGDGLTAASHQPYILLLSLTVMQRQVKNDAGHDRVNGRFRLPSTAVLRWSPSTSASTLHRL